MADYASLGFGDFLQQLAGQTVEAATAATYMQPYQLQAMQLQQLGPVTQQRYVEGVANQSLGINKNLLLLGIAAVVLVVVLKS